jgi:NADH dehydrogenase [ubiquinone] 1 alpha subcomplex assembly factor 6
MADDPSRYCIEQIRRLDHDRYLCALFAPADGQARLFALYAFNLEIARVRETVTQPVIGQMRLQWWRDAIGEFGRGQVRAHPVAQALARALAERPVRPELFERLLTAREFDLEDVPPADFAALEVYAEGTSSALLSAALDLLGIGDPAAEAAARHIGIAWALTGLLRAVPFHAQARRLYLPADMLARFAIEPDALFEGKARAPVRKVVVEIAARADEHLQAARALRQDVPRAALPVLLLARLSDRRLSRLRDAGFDPFAPAAQRPTPGDPARLALASLLKRY